MSAPSIDPIKLLALHSTQISNALSAKTYWGRKELIDAIGLARENTLVELINNLLGKSITLLGDPQ